MSKPKQGRVIRSYRRHIPVELFPVRSWLKGAGLYALYDKQGRLIYVGRATKSIRSRISSHLRAGKKPFASFSVFRVAGRSCDARVRRVCDLEALLLRVIEPRPEWNERIPKFMAASKLPNPSTSVQGKRAKRPRR